MAFPWARAQAEAFNFKLQWREGRGGKKERTGGWASKQVAQDHKDERRRTNSLGLQLKAEKVIYFVLRFLTTFSTLYNSNDSRKLQLPSSFLSPWLYKFSPALPACLPAHSVSVPLLLPTGCLCLLCAACSTFCSIKRAQMRFRFSFAVRRLLFSTFPGISF